MSNPNEWTCTLCHGKGVAWLENHGTFVCWACNGDLRYRYHCCECTSGYVACPPSLFDRLRGRSAGKRRCHSCRGTLYVLPETEPESHRQKREENQAESVRMLRDYADMITGYVPPTTVDTTCTQVMAREAGR